MAQKWIVKAESPEWMDAFRQYYNAMYNTPMEQNQSLPSIVDRYNHTVAQGPAILLEEWHA